MSQNEGMLQIRMYGEGIYSTHRHVTGMQVCAAAEGVVNVNVRRAGTGVGSIVQQRQRQLLGTL